MKAERYLREIRDLQMQNNELLQKLYGVEEDNISRRHWKTGFKVMGMLLPYFFSMFVAWTFYAKVMDSFDSFKNFFTDIPSSISKNIQGDVKENITNGLGSGIDAITEGGAVLWENRDEIINGGKDKLNEYIIR